MKIAFIKAGSFSHTNANVEALLAKHFPEAELEVIDVLKLVPTKTLANLLGVVREKGMGVFWRKTSLSRQLSTSVHYTEEVRRALEKRLAGRGYAFTFQTQSLFDASVPGVPHFIYTDHTRLANRHYPDFDARIFSSKLLELETANYRRAAAIFTMSGNITRSLLEDYGCDPGKVACAYVGSNISYPSDVDTSRERYAKRHILFVGVQWARKGGPLLAQAFKRVLDVYPDAKLSVVGCSPELELPNCQVLGVVSPQAVETFYRDASVFCLPTNREPLGIVFVEAANYKLPVVATRIGAIPEVVLEGESGLLIEPGDVTALTGALLTLLGDPEKCRAFGQAGFEHVRQHYTWENVGETFSSHIRARLGAASSAEIA